MGRGHPATRIGESTHVTFAAHADGNTWPAHGGTGSASFGAPAVGPAGLVSLLEEGLGLGGPPSSLIDRPDGFVLIDHKCFSGALALDDDRLRAFAAQPRGYARAVEAALGKPCLGVWVHQPVVGVVLGVGARSDADQRSEQPALDFFEP